MKVKELIKHLGTFPQDAEVLISKDSEGNIYHELDTNQSFGEGAFIPCGYRKEWQFVGESDPRAVQAIVIYPMG